ncbi:hypothetical protein [Streptomyces boninensis]|uniref:hypothetical protein n=1 Tax=Streptomyces boninensis TaxID=2039455 RepID=UPI003B2239EB
MKVSHKLAVAVVAIASIALSSPAGAGPPGGGGLGGNGDYEQDAEPGGETDGDNAIAKIRWNMRQNGTDDQAGTPPAPVGDWKPPACWYAPKYTPEEFQEYGQRFMYTARHDPDGQQVASDFHEKYVAGEPYKLYNMAKQGEGYWWDSFYDEDQVDDPYSAGCDKPWFWIDKGDPPPPVKNALNPEILAGLAYDKVRIPKGKVSMSPQGKQTVNLPTWIWLDKDTFHPVSVSADVDLLNLHVTTTAKPVSMTLDPGTDDAQVHPAGGTCTFNKDGSLGTPYTKGRAKETPPCGVTYNRSTENTGPYTLKATITWEMSWTGTGNPDPVDLPDATFETTTDVEVREVQTVTR